MTLNLKLPASQYQYLDVTKPFMTFKNWCRNQRNFLISPCQIAEILKFESGLTRINDAYCG